MVDPFPDLKIQIVKEIVNTGGAINVDEIPIDTGKEISAEEFHGILLDARSRVVHVLQVQTILMQNDNDH